ncbi:hypothetical protein FB382_000301 [Nocardioides ginsengisegetis]|uniref:Uncharacterized protein n=1 Tax=Nocardioides ginsengisegetis TaxID=661491 RepID=A0A7W3IWN7_9ACTN|nr:hypothetical protein [Nocardioides ginsengisegetis]MBA8802010.1 hypothetical protein [Nocardioides ginsengisegetis]
MHPDAFHALARSSPWRWTAVHLRHRSSWAGTVEAWLTRPDGVRLVGPDGAPVPRTLVGQTDRPSGPWSPPAGATFRPDGLVATRPGDSTYAACEHGDGLYWTNYSWLAMLDPVELSHHVDVSDLRVVEVAGREAWAARLVPRLGYDPRCGGNCCELLWSEAGLRADFPSDDDVPAAWRGRDYPSAYDVALDAVTGIVVRSHPVGGTGAPWLENDIVSAG